MTRLQGLAVASVSAGALVVAVAVASSALDDGRDVGGVPPVLTVTQSASASDMGVTLGVNAAAFSGTETFLGLTADFTELELGGRPVAAARIPFSQLTKSTVERSPAESGVPLPVDGQTLIVHLGPISATGPVVVDVRGIEVRYDDWQTELVKGQWSLVITPPPDRGEALRTEQLAGSGPVISAGVAVSVIGGIRSSTETRITVEFQWDDRHTLLNAPRLLVDGDPLHGVVAAEREQGRFVTFSFPATSWGSRATLELGPLVRESESAGFGWVDLDLPAVFDREHLTGEFDTSGSIYASDVRNASSGTFGEAVVTGIEFARTDEDSPVNVVNFKVAGNFRLTGDFGGGEAFALRLSDGTIIESAGTGENYYRDPTGAISGGTTLVSFTINDLSQLVGVVRLINNTEPQQLVRGDWRVAIDPVE